MFDTYIGRRRRRRRRSDGDEARTHSLAVCTATVLCFLLMRPHGSKDSTSTAALTAVVQWKAEAFSPLTQDSITFVASRSRRYFGSMGLGVYRDRISPRQNTVSSLSRTTFIVPVDTVLSLSPPRAGEGDSSPRNNKKQQIKLTKHDEMAKELYRTAKTLIQRIQKARNGEINPDNTTSEQDLKIISEETEKMDLLLSKLSDAVFRSPQSLTLYSLHDILVSLACLTRIQRRPLANLPYQRQVRTLWRRLEDREAEKYLSPKRWLDCVKAAAALELQETSAPFYARICARLTKGDALARLEPMELVQGLLWASGGFSHSATGSRYYQQQYQPCELQLVRAMARRLRKQSVRRSMDNPLIMQAVSATSIILKYNGGLDEAPTWVTELRQLAYTLFNERLSRHEDGALSTHEVATMFQCAGLIMDETDPMVTRLGLALHTNTTLELITFSEASKLFETLTRWRYLNASSVIQRMGKILIQKDQPLPRPRELNSVLRGVTLLCGGCSQTMSSYRELAERLFMQEDFLGFCNLGILSNFVWFASVAGVSAKTTECLGAHILEMDEAILESCPPKLACRILSSFTTLVVDRLGVYSMNSDDEELDFRLRDKLFCLFNVLGEHLLSAQLDPLDLSNALVAYSKASYTMDPGIFDHLAATLVSQKNESSVRQLARSLWACGKMSEWDRVENAFLPYLPYAKSMAIHMDEDTSQLSPQDVSQCAWAFAKLGLDDAALLDPILVRMREVVHLMTAQETTTCLWALSEIKRDAYESIFLLTRRIQNESILESFTPLEAMTVLYSLGRLDIRDEVAFRRLSQLILKQVDDITSSSAIANVFWAHKMVHLTPPQEILDAWAAKKLGLIPISSMKQGYSTFS